MSVKWKTKYDKLPEIIANAKTLNGKKVKVGAFDGEHAWLASIHEFGCTITPQNAQYLTVPTSPKSAGKKASEFSDLWTLRADSGELFLCRDTGKTTFEVLYWLTKSVTIPERSFLRAGHDKNIDRVLRQTEQAVGQVLSGEMPMEKLYELCGEQLATAIKKYARNLSSPPNSKITQEAKGSGNPLVDTGNMIESISWKVE